MAGSGEMAASRRPVASALLAAAAALLWAGSAAASPVVYTIQNTSSLSGNLEAEFDVSVTLSLGGPLSGTGSVSGALSDTPTGTITADTGNGPGGSGWTGDITFNDANIENNSPGNVSGGFSLSLGILGNINFNGVLSVGFIDIGLDAPPIGPEPLTSNNANPSTEWFFGPAPTGLTLASSVSGTVTGTGLLSGVNVAIPATGVGPGVGVVPIEGSIGNIPGGSQLSFGGQDLTLDLGGGAPQTVPLDVCIGATVFGACVGTTVTGITIELTSLSFTDVDADIVATSNVVVPEPSTLLLLGAGLAGVAAMGRRRIS